MKALETSLRNLLEGTKQFQIPLFQRPYSWNKENWQTLWEDLLTLYQEEGEDYYFLGPIVTESRSGTAEGISPFTVIDGQQRLITLTLLLATVRDYINNNKADLQEIANEIHEESLINRFKKNDKHYKILPTQEDREIYQSLIDHTDKEKGAEQICEAYNFFYNKISNSEHELEEESELKCELLKTVILEKLVFINITSDREQDDPYLIFESLNYKGQELTQADLVRNYIFMQLPTQKREEIYKQKWMPIQEDFKADLKDSGNSAKELTTAFWTFLRTYYGKLVSQKNIYKETKQYFKEGDGVEQQLDKLTRFTRYYQCIRFCKREPNPHLREKFDRLNRLDFTTSRIFLLNIYEHYANKMISLQKFLTILQYLESYFVRRLFLKIPTKSLGSIFTKLYTQIKHYDDLVEGLHDTLSKFEGNKRWPDDEEFCQHFVEFPLYNQNQRERAKLILESLENWQNKEQVNPNNLTIEHIMPQKLNKHWYEMLGKNYDSIHKKWLHTVGNLTLTAYNSELSDKPFQDKKEHLINSNISLNRYFQNVSVWNEQEIQRRAHNLTDKAVKIWPR